MASLNNLPTGMAKPAVRALTEAKIESLEQLAEMKEAEVSKLHGIGPKALRQLREALARKGMGFKEE